jgi:hypothetical protein
MAESILIVFFHLCLGSHNGLFHLGFETNFVFLSVVHMHDNGVIHCFVWPQNLRANIFVVARKTYEFRRGQVCGKQHIAF